MAFKIDKPLYHGTSAAAAAFIVGGYGFKTPLFLTEDKRAAIHYAKAATAYLERMAKDAGYKLISDGFAVFTFHSIPDQSKLVPDPYSDKEPGQWKYLGSIRGLNHFTVERQALQVDDTQRLALESFAIGMWRGRRKKK